jgi:hypothetical protein
MTFQNNRVNIPEGRHSLRGASSSDRWVNCPGSINLIDKVFKENPRKLRRSGEAAAEGNAAHTVAATALEDGSDIHEFRGIEYKVSDWVFMVDDQMEQGLQEYVDFVRSILGKFPDAKIYVEKPLSSMYDEDAFGTPDVVIIVPSEKLLIIIDLKYGKGITVEPNSKQLKYYGALALENHDFKFDKVDLWIAQPRIPHSKGTIRKASFTSDELLDWWFNSMLPAMEATRNPDAYLAIGEHCRFCPVRGHCPALKGETFNFDSDINPNHFTNEELGLAIDKLKTLIPYCTVLEDEAFKRAMSGHNIPGRKIVRKMSKRILKDEIFIETEEGERKISVEEAAKEQFGDQAFTEPKIKSPAQLDKLKGGKNFTARAAYKPDNGLTLVPIHDKREEVRRAMDRYMDQMEAEF